MATRPRSTTRSRSRSPKPSDALLGDRPVPVQNPLPKAQLAAVYTIKLVVPIAAMQIAPYMNQMIEDLHLSGAKGTGYYSGLVGTAAAVTQLLSVYPWARLSDKIGRAPVVVAGTLGLALSTILFGLSQSFTGILISRAFIGLFAGIIGALHSIVGELSDTTNASTAFPLYDICSALGFMIGPLIGGSLEHPAQQHPLLFDIWLFREYPYLLPCLTTSVFALFASALATFFLRETNKRPVVSPETPESATTAEAPPLDVRTLLSLPGLRAASLSSAAIGFVASSFNHVLVLAAYTPVDAGGLALSPSRIGYALSLMGFISIFLKLSLPIILRSRSATTVFIACTRVWPFAFAMFPILSLLSQAAANTEANDGFGPAKVWLWVAVSFVLFLSRVGTLTFGLIMILVKEQTPSPAALGAANGLSELLQMVGGGIGNLFISTLFAFSISSGALGGALWVAVTVVLSAGASVFSDRGLSKRGVVRLE